MRLFELLMVCVVVITVIGCQPEAIKAPVAKINAHVFEEFGEQRVDNYFWLREREKPEVIAYLEAENAYTKSVLADVSDLREDLYKEIIGRIRPDETSVPYRDNGFFYHHSYREGDEYPKHFRAPDGGSEETLLNVKELAAGHDFCSVRYLEVSPDNAVLAFAIDTIGRRKYSIRFKKLSSGEFLDDEIKDVVGQSLFANDNQTVFYTRQDPDTLRAYQVWRHTLGTETDVLVFEEPDETFSLSIKKSKSRDFILIGSHQTLSDEWYFVNAGDPAKQPQLITGRQRNLEYEIDHIDNRWVILTNHEAHNFRLMVADEKTPEMNNWSDLVAHRPEVFVEDFELFDSFFAVSERRDGLRHISIHQWDGETAHEIAFDEGAYAVWGDDNFEADSEVFRFVYTSLTTPETTYDYNIKTREKTLLKQAEVLGGFDSSNYQTTRLFAQARDGQSVPISLVSKKGIELNGKNPLLLYAYGSYGYSIEPEFSSPLFSLIDRGFVYAIAHIRGGQELGRSWYEDGKLLNKKNTFNDFIDCAQFLVNEGWTSPELLAAEGGSAGGLLMGAVTNMAPDLFTAIVAHVAYVDVITTMLDETIPLTTSEFDEWGNPKNKEYYDYMLSYSPYDQVEAKAYPNMLITAGLHDSQVQYWEPAKWAARLRALKTNDNILLLETNMDAGHGGSTGRFQEHEETALEYAFLLKALGLS